MQRDGPQRVLHASGGAKPGAARPVPRLSLAGVDLRALGSHARLGALTARENERVALLERQGVLTTRAKSEADGKAGLAQSDGKSDWKEYASASTTGEPEFERLLEKLARVVEQREALLEAYVGQTFRPETLEQCGIEPGRRMFLRCRIRPSLVPCTAKLDVDVVQGRVELLASTRDEYPSLTRPERLLLTVPSFSASRTVLISVRSTSDSPPAFLYLTLAAASACVVSVKVTLVAEGSRHARTRSVASVPSSRMIQQQLEERLRELREDSAAFAELQDRVARLRGAQSARAAQGAQVVRRNLETHRSRPDVARERRAAWIKEHDMRALRACQAHGAIIAERQERVQRALKARDERQMIFRQELKLLRMHQEHQRSQQWWLRLLCARTAAGRCVGTLAKWRHQNDLTKKRHRAARVIQKFVRAQLVVFRRARAARHLQGLRSMLRLAAVNQFLIAKHRAADLLKVFLENVSGVDSVSRMVANFRRRVVLVQRLIRKRYMVREARLHSWSLQWSAVASLMQDPLATAVPPVVKREVLLAHMQRLQNEAADSMERYQAELASFHTKVRLEAARAMVSRGSASAVLSKLRPPAPPRVPAVLPVADMCALVKSALAKLTGAMRGTDGDQMQVLKPIPVSETHSKAKRAMAAKIAT